MLNRRLYHWRVKLANTKNGNTKMLDFRTYWDPEQRGADDVSEAAAAMCSRIGGDQFITVERPVLVA